MRPQLESNYLGKRRLPWCGGVISDSKETKCLLDGLFQRFGDDVFPGFDIEVLLNCSYDENETQIEKILEIANPNIFRSREVTQTVLALDEFPFFYCNKIGLNLLQKLPWSDERRQLFQIIFLVLLRNHVKLQYNNNVSFLESYPSLKNRSDMEIDQLRLFANTISLAFHTKSSLFNQQFLIELVTRMCKLQSHSSTNGSSSSVTSEDFVSIYQKEAQDKTSLFICRYREKLAPPRSDESLSPGEIQARKKANLSANLLKRKYEVVNETLQSVKLIVDSIPNYSTFGITEQQLSNENTDNSNYYSCLHNGFQKIKFLLLNCPDLITSTDDSQKWQTMLQTSLEKYPTQTTSNGFITSNGRITTSSSSSEWQPTNDYVNTSEPFALHSHLQSSSLWNTHGNFLEPSTATTIGDLSLSDGVARRTLPEISQIGLSNSFIPARLSSFHTVDSAAERSGISPLIPQEPFDWEPTASSTNQIGDHHVNLFRVGTTISHNQSNQSQPRHRVTKTNFYYNSKGSLSDDARQFPTDRDPDPI